MSEKAQWTIKAYEWQHGEFQLSEWASGFAYTQAVSYYKELHDSDKFAKISMCTEMTMKQNIN